MAKNKSNKFSEQGDEAPRWKDFVTVLAVLLLLIVLSWLAYYQWHILK